MGTTESAFFYEDNDETAPPTPQHPSAAGAAPASSEASTTPPLTRRKVAPRQAKRPSGVNPHRPPSVKLKGHILGLPESGKRTLLARLQGKDPFRPSADDAPVLEGVQHLLPYQAPSDQPSWDRIQLVVHCAEDFVQAEPLDFAVVLVNPQHKRKKVKRYLVERLQRLLHMLGYRMDGSTEAYPLRPFCLCVLLNFRDLSLAKTHVEESNVTMWTMEVLQDYSSLDPQRLVLQCGRTSLLNCYGLSLLHHFIYQSYLFHRQFQLESELLQVRQTQQHTKAPPVQDYDEFLAILDGKAPPQRKEKKKKHHDVDSGRRKVMPQVIPGEPRGVVEELPPSPPSPPPPKSTKDDLEAFLASSDEEDEPETKAASRRKDGPHVESDSEDEEDFVVNEVSPDTPEVSENNETSTGQSKEAVDTVVSGHENEQKELAAANRQRKNKSAISQASTANSSVASVTSKQSVDEAEEKAVESNDIGQTKAEAVADEESSNGSTQKEQEHSDAASPKMEDSGEMVGRTDTKSDPDESSADGSTASPQNDLANVDSESDESSSHGEPVEECIHNGGNTKGIDSNETGTEEEQNLTNKGTNGGASHGESGEPEKSSVPSPVTPSGDKKSPEERANGGSDDDDSEEFFVGESESQDVPDSRATSAVSKTKIPDPDEDNSDEEFFVGEADTAEDEGLGSKGSQDRDKRVDGDKDTTSQDEISSQIIPKGTSAPRENDGGESEEEEEEFLVEETSSGNRNGTETAETLAQSTIVSKPAHETEEAKPASSPSPGSKAAAPENPSGLSAAAMAAIVAAQKDFENMVHPSVPGDLAKKKKKKDKEAKEKKKDKKKKKEAAVG